MAAHDSAVIIIGKYSAAQQGQETARPQALKKANQQGTKRPTASRLLAIRPPPDISSGCSSVSSTRSTVTLTTEEVDVAVALEAAVDVVLAAALAVVVVGWVVAARVVAPVDDDVDVSADSADTAHGLT